LLVIALLSISVGVTGDILLSLVRSFSKTQILTEIEQQSNFVSQKLEKELKSASSVSLPIVDTSGDILIFTTDTGNVTYELKSGVLLRGPIPITSNEKPGGVQVTCGCPDTSGCFHHEDSSVPKVVSFCLVFKQADTGAMTPFTGDITIKKTVVLRKSY
jgi:hypothetical protein